MSEQVWTVPSMRDDPDYQLVRAMAAGENEALDTLYARHGAALLAYLIGQLGQRSLAEEVLQDVMLAAWEGAARFRGESQVRTWLLGIARYRAANARRRVAPELLPLRDDLAAPTSHPTAALEQKESRCAIQGALADLPPEQRETLELLFFHELSGAEVARVTGVAPGTVKSRLHRARAALKQILRKKEGEDAG